MHKTQSKSYCRSPFNSQREITAATTEGPQQLTIVIAVAPVIAATAPILWESVAKT